MFSKSYTWIHEGRSSQALATLILFVASAALGIAPQPAQAEDAALRPRPNVVVFLADDLGWGDLSCYGHPVIQTPHLDRFAKEGVRFTQCYAACGVCSPSRSAIQTGRTPYRNGVFRWIPERHECHLRTSEVTIAEQLKSVGYTTCHVGKWHLNGYFNSPEQPQPNDHGYDWWFATQNNAGPSHKDPSNFVRNGKPVGQLQGFSAQLIVEEADHWLREHRDPQKPFFITVWTHEPHLPIESDPKFMAQYPQITDAGLKQHHGNVTQLDDAFGRMMKTLEDLKVADNTIVFFTSDNGPEGSGLPDKANPGGMRDRTRGSTGGLRGRKRDCYEGGIRVPGIVRWPGHIKPGVESSVPVIGSDIFTTVCSIVDVPLPTDRTIDGADIRPAFVGQPVERSQPLYWRTRIAKPDCRVALRIGDWKIVGNEDMTSLQLFNIQQDPQETKELSESNPADFARLKAALLKMDAEVKAEGPDWWQHEQPEDRKKPAQAKPKQNQSQPKKAQPKKPQPKP